MPAQHRERTPALLQASTYSDKSPPGAYSIAIAKWCGVMKTSCHMFNRKLASAY